MKISILLVLFFFCFPYSKAYTQIDIELHSGENYRGIILSNSNDSITIRNLENFNISLSKKDIENIDSLTTTIKMPDGKTHSGKLTELSNNVVKLLIDGKECTFLRKDIITLKMNKTNKNIYPIFGATLFLPGGLNILGGFQFGSFGIRAGVGGIPTNEGGWGTQANILVNLYQDKSVETNLSLCGGYWKIGLKEFKYLGPCFDMNVDGFFVELGLGFGSGDYKSPQVLFQLGYVYRFN